MSTQFKPETAVLMLIDHQVGTLSIVKTMSPETSLKNAIALGKAAQLLGIPIIMTTSDEDQAQGPTAPALAKALPDAYAARKKRTGIVNAWADPAVKAAVVATGRKQVIMAAVTTDVCLIFPAISAVHEGFEVQAVVDASGSPFQASEDVARERMRGDGVVLTATNTLLAELAQDWCSPRGSGLAALLASDVMPPMQAAPAAQKKAA